MLIEERHEDNEGSMLHWSHTELSSSSLKTRLCSSAVALSIAVNSSRLPTKCTEGEEGY